MGVKKPNFRIALYGILIIFAIFGIFVFTSPSNASMNLENPTVNPGDSLNIFTTGANGYQIAVQGFPYSSGTGEAFTYDITSNEQTIQHLIPDDVNSGDVFVWLLDPDGEVIECQVFSIENQEYT